MDHSGSLSSDELKGYPSLSKNFTSADANNDGKLSPAEYSALISKSSGSMDQED
jgi:hypothetical protein